MHKPVYVTQPTLAPLEEVNKHLKKSWASGVLTHNGPLVQELEGNLKQKLNAPNLSVVLNGTIALQMAIRALSLKGEIITTPFTYVATICAINWEGCQPVFCDIHPETLNIDEKKIEALITPKTVAIMPVHVFGTACNVKKIDQIAKKHHLKVIYDAAHAIGTKVEGESVLNYGDVSCISLHATKLINAGEGGACITSSKDLDKKFRAMRFYGHNEHKEVVLQGFNGKMTEVHAALGLANLKYYQNVLDDRHKKYRYYLDLLKDTQSIKFQKVKHETTNYSYFPVIFETEELLLKVTKAFNKENIFPRRYFYPSVNTLKNIVDYQETPISEVVSSRILCLPLYYNLEYNTIQKIVQIIRKTVG